MPKRDFILRLLLIWVTLLSVIVWLPLVRGLLNGDSYQWAFVRGVGGHGTGGDYWMLPVAFVYVMPMQYAGRRGPRVLFPILLLPLLIAFDAAVLYAAWTNPGALRFQGATFGIDVSLAQVLPALFTLFVLLAVWWTVRQARRGFAHAEPPWTRTNAIILLIAVLIVPVQFWAFRYGGEQGNQIGVVLTIVQWFLLNAGLNTFTPRHVPAAA